MNKNTTKNIISRIFFLRSPIDNSTGHCPPTVSCIRRDPTNFRSRGTHDVYYLQKTESRIHSINVSWLPSRTATDLRAEFFDFNFAIQFAIPIQNIHCRNSFKDSTTKIRRRKYLWEC